jgi:hypothetical protein
MQMAKEAEFNKTACRARHRVMFHQTLVRILRGGWMRVSLLLKPRHAPRFSPAKHIYAPFCIVHSHRGISANEVKLVDAAIMKLPPSAM